MATLRRCEGKRYRVLVVDDHPLARNAFSTLLSVFACSRDVQSVLEAESGEEALEQMHTFEPHAAVIDIRLPGISGFEAARRLRDEMPGVAIIMVTAFEEPGYRETALSLGAGFVTKDRAFSDLHVLLSQALGQASAGG